MKIKWIGLARFQRKAGDASRKIPRALRERLTKGAAVVIRTGARKYFKGERTKAIRSHKPPYRRRKSPRPITSPPDKLGSFTGAYRNKMGFDVRRRGRGAEAVLGTPADIGKYAAAHEFGLGRMPARPVFSRAAKDEEDFIVRQLGLTFMDAWNRG